MYQINMQKSNTLPKGLLLTIIVLISLLSSVIIVSSEQQSFGTFKQGSCVNLIQTCSNCSFVNLSITNPNSTVVISNQLMTKTGTVYNYSFCDTYTLGQYIYNTCGDVNGVLTCSPVNFFITPSGNQFSISQAVIYILVFSIGLLIFIGLLILGLALPTKNNTDEMTGYVIAVSNLKYFKILSLALSYVVLIVLSYFSWQVTYAYLDLAFLSGIFQFIFFLLLGLLLPLFILGVYITIANAIRDAKLNDFLSRGLSTRDI